MGKLEETRVHEYRLGDLVTIPSRSIRPEKESDHTLSVFSLPAYDNGQQPEATTHSDLKSAKTALDEPAVLISKLNPHIPRVWKVATPPVGACCSPEFFPLVVNDPCQVDLGFLYYYVLNSMRELAGKITGSTNSHKRLQKQTILSLKVHLPSLGHQREIADILDTFTALQGSLEIELEARRKQYTFYREKLLAPPEATG